MRPHFPLTSVSDFTPSGAPSKFDGAHSSQMTATSDHASIAETDVTDPTPLVVFKLTTRPSFYGLWALALLCHATSLILNLITNTLHYVLIPRRLFHHTMHRSFPAFLRFHAWDFVTSRSASQPAQYRLAQSKALTSPTSEITIERGCIKRPRPCFRGFISRTGLLVTWMLASLVTRMLIVRALGYRN